MAEAGYASLLVAAALGCAGCGWSLVPGFFSRPALWKESWQVSLLLGQVLALVLAGLIFLWGAWNHPDTWITLWESSHPDLPLAFRLASMWTSPEGSFLVWLVILAAVAGSAATDRRIPAVPAQWVLWGSTVCALAAGHPFETAPSSLAHSQGLNPLLDHPVLVIHPPFLYAGYAATLPLFCLGWSPAHPEHTARLAGLWATGAWVLLGTGIALGSFWAYSQPGWGGWWFWDPSENAALVPWLLLTGLVHHIPSGSPSLFQRMMLLLPFLMVQAGQWGVRAGLWASVHSFATRHPWHASLGLMTAGTLLLGLAGILRTPPPTFWGPGPTRTRIQPLALLVLAGTVAISVWGPVVLAPRGGPPAALDPEFYHALVVPLFLLLLGGSIPGPWMSVTARGTRSSIILLCFLGTGAGSAFWFCTLHPGASFCASAAWGTATAMITSLLAGFLLHRPKRTWRCLLPRLVHLGLAISVAGMAADSLGTRATVVMHPGQRIRHTRARQHLVLDDLVWQASPSGTTWSAALHLVRADGSTASPPRLASLCYHTTRDLWTADAAVFRTLSGDLVVTPTSLLHESRAVRLAIEDHPLVSLIWAGWLLGVLAALGSLCTALCSRTGKHHAQP